MKIFIIFVFFILSPTIYSKEKTNYYCTIEPTADMSIFHCLDIQSEKSISQRIPPILESQTRAILEEKGVKFLDESEYSAQVLLYFIDQVKKIGETKTSCFQKTSFRPHEFFSGSFIKEAIKRLKEVATSLKGQGICSAKIDTSDRHNQMYGVTNNDELLKHFLCISNKESTLGKDYHGKGGRGLFGINPKTNSSSCGGLNPKDPNSNTKCALKLFQNNQLADWGFPDTQKPKNLKKGSKGKSWGSNQYCTPDIKSKFNFSKILGADSCCSEDCKKTFANSEVESSY